MPETSLHAPAAGSAAAGARASPRREWIAVLLLLAVVVVAVVAVHDDFGVTWDEGAQARYGQLALDYYATAGRDLAVNRFYNLKYYGPIVEMAAGAAARARPAAPFETRHLVLGLLAALAIPAIAGFARLFRRPHLPLLSATILVVLPRFTGHAFNNSKDIPFALGVIVFMTALVPLFVDRDDSWRRVLLAGLALGLALSVRPGGILLLGLFFVGTSILARATVGRQPSGASTEGRKAAILGLAWLVLFLSWPWAQEHPLKSLADATALAVSFPLPIPVLFEGRIVASHDLPWYYLPKFLLLTTPPTLLALFLAGTIVSAVRAVRERRSRETALAALTLMWFFLPVALFVARRPPVYDGLRHFLFILPALAVLAAVGASELRRVVRARAGDVAAWAVVGVLVLLPVKDLIRLHPYQMTYFNGLAGGLREAAGRYETDYWIAGYRAAIQWLNATPAVADGRRVDVLVAGQPVPEPDELTDGPECWTERRKPYSLEISRNFVKEAAAHAAAANVTVHILPELWDAGIPADRMDFYVATTRFGYDRCFPDAPVIHRVGRDGATFVIVKDLRGMAGSALPGGSNRADESDPRGGAGQAEGSSSTSSSSVATATHPEIVR